MKPYGRYFKPECEIYIYGILLISAILPALLAVKNIIISPDSMMYALISQEILSGNGIRLPMIYDLRDTVMFMNGTVPVVLDPPLFSILLALLGGVTSQSFLAAQTLNVVSHAVISVCTFLLVKEICDNKGIALLAGILVPLSLPLMWNAHHMISESLFIAVTVAALYFLILSRDSDKPVRILFLAGICTSAAVSTKYAGLSLLPVFYWGTLVLVKNKRIKPGHISHILTTLLPVFTAGVLFSRAYIISGSIHGWNPPSPERSYADAFTGTIKMIFLQFGLGERSVTLLIICSLLLIFYIGVSAHFRRELSKLIQSGLDLIVIFMLCHTALISYAMAKSQTVFEFRYMSPLAPFLFILSILIIAVVWGIIGSKGFSKVSVCGLIVSLSIIALGSCYKTYAHSNMFFSRQEKQYFILKSPTYKWIKENYGEDVIMTSNRPYHLSFFGGYSTIRLPHRRFEKNSWIPDDMETYLPERMSHFGSKVLVLFEEADEEYEGRYIARLFNKREDDKHFTLTRTFSDGVVYRLKGQLILKE